jgi:hypothetical protein
MAGLLNGNCGGSGWRGKEAVDLPASQAVGWKKIDLAADLLGEVIGSGW